MDTIKVYETENQEQKVQITDLQAEVEQIKQLLELLQEKREGELSESPRPQHLSPRLIKKPSHSPFDNDDRPILSKASSRSEAEKSAKKHLTPRFEFSPTLIRQNSNMQKGVSQNNELSSNNKDGDVQTTPKIPKIENNQTVKFEEKRKSVAFNKVNNARTRATTINVSIKQRESKVGIPQIKNKVVPLKEKQETKIKVTNNNAENKKTSIVEDTNKKSSEVIEEVKTTKIIEDKNDIIQEKIKTEGLDQDVTNYLRKIDLSRENVKKDFLKILENFLNKEPQPSSQNIERTESAMQTDNNFFYPQMGSFLSSNNNPATADETSQNFIKKELTPSVDSFSHNLAPTQKRLNFSVDYNELLNLSKETSTKLEVSNMESQKNIIDKSKTPASEYFNNSFHGKFNKIAQKVSTANTIASSPQLPSLKSSIDSKRGYLATEQQIIKTPQQKKNSQNSIDDIKSTKSANKSKINFNNNNYLIMPNEIKDARSLSSYDLPMGFSSDEKFTKWKNDKEVIEEEEEQSIMTKEVFEHLKRNKKEDPNFAKNRHFFNYPFKKVEDFAFISQDQNTTNALINNDQLSFDNFKSLFNRFLDAHKKCGKNCKHLKRFYKAIGFVNNRDKYRLLEISKTVISKLPKII